MMRRFFILAVIFSGCTSHSSSSPDAIRIQLASEPVSLDPAMAEDGIALRILANTTDGLVGYDNSGELRNRLAESYQVSLDKKRYEFVLRKDALWSDGRPVRIQDFILALRRSLDPASGARLTEVLLEIRGARNFRAGKISASELGVREESGKLVIELERPIPYFVQALTLPVALPVREDVLKAHGGRWPNEAPVTGAYRIASYQPDRQILLEPNPKYYAADSAALPVQLLIVRDESTAVALFEQKKLDILYQIPDLDLLRLKQRGVVRTDPFFAVYYLAFNVLKPPFNDVQWRRAVAGSIRRDEIVSALGTGEGPARSWIPKGIEGYFPYSDPAPEYSDAVKKTRAQIARNGAAPVIAAFSSGSRNSLVMEKVQRDVMAALGLQLSLSAMDWKTYVGLLRTDAPPIFRYGWMAPYKDPITHLMVFTSGSPNNFSHWSNAEYDQMISRIATLAPGPEREKLIFRAQEVLNREAVVIPIYHYVQTHAISPRVQGFKVNSFGIITYSELRLLDHHP